MKRYSEEEIKEIVDILNKNGVVSVPTDTVYGLCAKMNSKLAHDNLVNAKKRPETKPFPVMCADEEQIRKIANVTSIAEKIIRKFMPGPITIVLRKKSDLPEYVTNGKDTIAIRMATSKVLEQIIKKVNCPIFMSSANKSGKETCKNLDEIEKMCPEINGMLEGKAKFGMPSTIVDCTGEKIKIIREGPITEEEIKEAVEGE